MRKKLLILTLSAILISSVLCGAIWSKPEVVLDTEKYSLYQNTTATGLITAFTGDFDAASERYGDGKLSVLGKVAEVASNGKTFFLAPGSGTVSGTIECTMAGNLTKESILQLKPGDQVRVLGTLSTLSIFGRKSYKLEAEVIDTKPSTMTMGALYFYEDGTSVDIRNMTAQTLADKKIRYTIPPEWKAVEHNISDEGLGSIDGYQYRLNEIPDSASIEPESLFVCYFDNSRLSKSSDRKETKLIEEAVIKNILDLEVITGFPLRTDKTYYGTEYHYYQNSYHDSLGYGYHTEFVFQPVGNDGIVVYLYVYKDAKHRNEIMSVMRFLTVD